MGVFNILRESYESFSESCTQSVCKRVALEVAESDDNYLHLDSDEAYQRFGERLLKGENLGIRPSQHTVDVFKEHYVKQQINLLEKRDARNIELDRIYRDHGLTCQRCGELALPIIDTRRRYRCEGCGCQFVGAFHGY